MIVFLHIPKTAGTTMRFILANSFGIRHCHTNNTKTDHFTPDDFRLAQSIFPKMTSMAGHNLIDPPSLQVPDPYYITFLREPITRVFSGYQDSVLRGVNTKTFEESIVMKDALRNLQVRLIAGAEDLDKAKLFIDKKCHFVGLTASFDLSLSVLLKLCPYPIKPAYKRRIVATDNTIKKSLQADDKMVQLATEHNSLDVALYEFATTEIFPRLCEEAGLKDSDNVPSFDKYHSKYTLPFITSRFMNKAIYRQACKINRKRTNNHE